MSTFTEYAGSGVYVCDPEPPADGGRTLNDNFRALVDRGAAVAGDLSAHAADTAAHGATSGNTAGRIVARDTSGNVEVGRLTAAGVVNTAGTYVTAGDVAVSSAAGTGVGQLDLLAGPYLGNPAFGACAAAVRLLGYSAGGDGKILFRTTQWNVGSFDRMVITNVGDVGIGTTAPAARLDVAGTAKATRFVGDGVCPVGAVVQFAGATAPAGWLPCDGSAVSRATYAELFALVGTTYGAGNGSTTFNVPTLTGTVGVGYVVKA